MVKILRVRCPKLGEMLAEIFDEFMDNFPYCNIQFEERSSLDLVFQVRTQLAE